MHVNLAVLPSPTVNPFPPPPHSDKKNAKAMLDQLFNHAMQSVTSAQQAITLSGWVVFAYLASR